MPQDKHAEETAFAHWSQGKGWVPFTERTSRRIADYFLRQLYCQQSLNILEIGCGTGEHTVHLCCYRNRVFSCDLSKSCVRATRHKNPQVPVFVADAEQLPFKDESFDAIFLGSLLHHFPDTAQLLKECRRILCTGGMLFAFDPNKYNPIVLFYRVILGSRTLKTDNEVLYSRNQLFRNLQDASFVQLEVDTAVPIYFTRAYYTQCLGLFLGYIVYPCNLLEWAIFLLPGLRKYLGSFLISRAIK